MKKKFIITMDTEGDNLWDWKPGMPIATQNVLYLQRFQRLCNRYGFKPVWLTNYEMISDSHYVDFISEVEETKTGELGMHLHAWNSPPEYNLPIEQSGAPYLIEYPVEIMAKKIEKLTALIKERTGVVPASHRAGRWAMNDDYFHLLICNGYKIDCSVTPHINWNDSLGQTRGAVGSDYSQVFENPYDVIDAKTNSQIFEVPVTIRKSHRLFLGNHTFRGFAGSVKRAIRGEFLWLRPNGNNLSKMKALVDMIEHSNSDYIMFMLHSSELMPGGSPTFRTESSIEKLYKDLEEIFQYAEKKFEGSTLKEYAKTKGKL